MFWGRLCVRSTATHVLPRMGPARRLNRNVSFRRMYPTINCIACTNVHSLMPPAMPIRQCSEQITNLYCKKPVHKYSRGNSGMCSLVPCDLQRTCADELGSKSFMKPGAAPRHPCSIK